MPKMSFNSHKSWHVHSKGNRDILEKAEQKNDEKDSASSGRNREREKERDYEATKRMAQKYNQNLRSEQALTFMYEPPPGMPKEEEKPEDHVPDIPENKEVREFLKNAPTKGLWMPLGKEVKVMQCWRCKNYGHRTGDKECPLSGAGNVQAENERLAREDPMAAYLQERKDQEQQKDTRAQRKAERLQELKDLLAKAEKRYMKKKLKRKMVKKEEEKRKKRKKEKRHKSRRDSGSSSSDSSGSESDSESGNDRKKE